MSMDNKISESINIVVNSLAAGVIKKSDAINALSSAIKNRCLGCIKDYCMNGITDALELYSDTSEIGSESNTDSEYPLDSITYSNATILFAKKGMVFQCENGHVLGIYKSNNEMEVESYVEKQRIACF
ncbi:MAG: hypothetical protein Q8920_04370 [Bacillota bacterium]|nr:hypothetical protein [Bacillota bacterium]